MYTRVKLTNIITASDVFVAKIDSLDIALMKRYNGSILIKTVG